MHVPKADIRVFVEVLGTCFRPGTSSRPAAEQHTKQSPGSGHLTSGTPPGQRMAGGHSALRHSRQGSLCSQKPPGSLQCPRGPGHLSVHPDHQHHQVHSQTQHIGLGVQELLLPRLGGLWFCLCVPTLQLFQNSGNSSHPLDERVSDCGPVSLGAC